MNVVDSSGWIEYFAYGPNVAFFAPVIENTPELIVPTITIYEVYKWVLLYGGSPKTTWNISLLVDAYVVPMDSYLAVEAAENALKFKLSVADSIILTTTKLYGATLWTQDAHFAGIPDVKYIAKP
jgi:predicted nucleic acid-binding protein